MENIKRYKLISQSLELAKLELRDIENIGKRNDKVLNSAKYKSKVDELKKAIEDMKQELLDIENSSIKVKVLKTIKAM